MTVVPAGIAGIEGTTTVRYVGPLTTTCLRPNSWASAGAPNQAATAKNAGSKIPRRIVATPSVSGDFARPVHPRCNIKGRLRRPQPFGL
jgi:hypothetical protein